LIKRKNFLYRVVISFLYVMIIAILGMAGYAVYALISQARVQPETPVNSTANLAQLAQGIQSYAKGHNGNLPDMMLQKTFKQQLYPYVKSDAVFVSEISPQALQPNWRLDRKKEAAIGKNTVVMFDPTDDIDGTYSVLYGSWQTAKVTKVQLDDGLENP
jgi:hypothetical protein